MVINSLGNGGSTLQLFSVPLVLGAKEREEEGQGRGWRSRRDSGGKGETETKPERETMTLEVTHSYPELSRSEGRIMKGFPCLLQPEDNPMATAPFLIPFSVCCMS